MVDEYKSGKAGRKKKGLTLGKSEFFSELKRGSNGNLQRPSQMGKTIKGASKIKGIASGLSSARKAKMKSATRKKK